MQYSPTSSCLEVRCDRTGFSILQLCIILFPTHVLIVAFGIHIATSIVTIKFVCMCDDKVKSFRVVQESFH